MKPNLKILSLAMSLCLLSTTLIHTVASAETSDPADAPADYSKDDPNLAQRDTDELEGSPVVPPYSCPACLSQVTTNTCVRVVGINGCITPNGKSTDTPTVPKGTEQ